MSISDNSRVRKSYFLNIVFVSTLTRRSGPPTAGRNMNPMVELNELFLLSEGKTMVLMHFNQVFQRKTLVIKMMNISGRALVGREGGWSTISFWSN